MKRIMFLMAMLTTTNLTAATLTCDNTKVKHVAYHANNRLMVQLENMNQPVFFCNTEANWTVSGSPNVVGPETCKALFSMFLSAKASGQLIERVHFDGDDIPETCDTWGPWKSAHIRYIRF